MISITFEIKTDEIPIGKCISWLRNVYLDITNAVDKFASSGASSKRISKFENFLSQIGDIHRNSSFKSTFLGF